MTSLTDNFLLRRMWLRFRVVGKHWRIRRLKEIRPKNNVIKSNVIKNNVIINNIIKNYVIKNYTKKPFNIIKLSGGYCFFWFEGLIN